MILFEATIASPILGWILVVTGMTGVVFALVIAGIDGVRKALAASGTPPGLGATFQLPWDKVVDAVRDLLLALLETVAGPLFLFGLILVAGGVALLHFQPI